jgi:ATP-dependent DNA helicase RecG
MKDLEVILCNGENRSLASEVCAFANACGGRGITRNSVIASLLHRIHYIERMGTGIERIKRDLREVKQKMPKFSTSGFFKVVFRRENAVENVIVSDNFLKVRRKIRRK